MLATCTIEGGGEACAREAQVESFVQELRHPGQQHQSDEVGAQECGH